MLFVIFNLIALFKINCRHASLSIYLYETLLIYRVACICRYRCLLFVIFNLITLFKIYCRHVSLSIYLKARGCPVGAMPENAAETVDAVADEAGPEEQLDAVSAVLDSESEQAFGPQNAPSTSSTQVPRDPPPRALHGRQVPGDPPPRALHGRARNQHQHRSTVCGCRCRNTSRGDLGPREPDGQRCACPLCGHQSSDRGHGCHFRVPVPPFGVQGVILCDHCKGWCLHVLRHADDHYERRRRMARP